MFQALPPPYPSPPVWRRSTPLDRPAMRHPHLPCGCGME